MQELEIGQISSVQIIEDVLVVNNSIVPYKEQILRNKNTLFVVDLGIEVPVDDQLREYDEYYFQFLLTEQIVAEIQASHITIGLAVLQAMPQIEQQHYAYIFRKLSITKVTKMLMSDDFLVFLASTFHGFAGVEMRHEEIKEAIVRLVQPYQRVIFLLKILEEQSGELKEEVHATAQEILYTMIDQANFIQNLAYPENNQQAEEEDDDDEEKEKTKEEFSVSKDLNQNFLAKLCQFAISTQYIQRIPLELRSEFSYQLNKDVKEKVFSKDCFKIIGRHFYDLSLSERRNLLLVMNLLATHNCDNFWNELILCPSLNKPTETEGGQELHETSITTVDNVNTLKVLLQSNYYSNNFSDWDQSMLLLQQLCEGKGEADLMLTQLFEDLVHNPNIQAIDLFTVFTRKVFQRNKEYMPHFKRIITTFLTSTSEGVERLYKDYQHFQRFQSLNKIKSTVVMLMKLNFPRINSMLACAYLRVFNVVITHNLYDFVSTIDLQKPIELLLILTNNRGGAIEGSRKALMRLITIKLQNLKIKTRSSHSKSLSLPLPKLRAYLQTQS